MSICKTEKRSGDLLPKEVKESGVNSKQFDYLLKNNMPEMKVTSRRCLYTKTIVQGQNVFLNLSSHMGGIFSFLLLLWLLHL